MTMKTFWAWKHSINSSEKNKSGYIKILARDMNSAYRKAHKHYKHHMFNSNINESVMSGETKLLPDTSGDSMLPSVVHCGINEMSVGVEALALATSDPVNTISSIKRFMGISFNEAQSLKNLPYDLVDQDGGALFIPAKG